MQKYILFVIATRFLFPSSWHLFAHFWHLLWLNQSFNAFAKILNNTMLPNFLMQFTRNWNIYIRFTVWWMFEFSYLLSFTFFRCSTETEFISVEYYNSNWILKYQLNSMKIYNILNWKGFSSQRLLIFKWYRFLLVRESNNCNFIVGRLSVDYFAQIGNAVAENVHWFEDTSLRV